MLFEDYIINILKRKIKRNKNMSASNNFRKKNRNVNIN